MATIVKRNTQTKGQRIILKKRPEKKKSDQDQLEHLLFQPLTRPNHQKHFSGILLKKPKTNISLGLPQKPSQNSVFGDSSLKQTLSIFNVDNHSDKRQGDLRPKSRLEEIPTLYQSRLSSKPVTVKNMPNTLPPIKFPKIENQPLAPYYIKELNKALEDQSNRPKLAPYREQFEQLCQASSLFSDSDIKPSKKITLPKADKLKKTIILDLDETLIHTNEAIETATTIRVPLRDGQSSTVKIHIRPYCRQFLSQLSQIAEVIVFTAGNSRYADLIIDHLDPQRKFISHRLYRENCTFEKNYFIKDLRQINRNLSDMVIVDNSPYTYVLNMDNAVPILPFFGDSKDSQLKSVLNYLKQVIKVKDVRDLNKSHFKLTQYVQDFLTITESYQ